MATEIMLSDTASPDADGPEATRDPSSAKLSQSRLIWRRFRKHKLAMLGLAVTTLLYVVVVFADFLAPYGSGDFNADYTYAPPQSLRLVDQNGDWGLHVNPLTLEQDPDTLALTFSPDRTQKVDVGFFVKGREYQLLGFITSDRHLIGPTDPDAPPMHLLGADRNGRDVLSRMVLGTRISMTIGLVGVVIAFALGIAIGGVSGFIGGRTDMVIQRGVEFFMAIPTLPLWLGLAAAIPRDWSPTMRYFMITVVLSFVAWTGLAREVRGRFLSLREEQFVMAARLDGASRPGLIFSEMLPSLMSHLIATVTLAIPGMILAETSLSFLGLGLQAPSVSWGVLLQEAQQVRVIATAPWLLLPGVAVVIAVLALNFLGDGLRDAADPYKR
ncbi:MAG TPA: ABC transporter permease [Candidatus Avipropionibacterium avicola]|uniref:ABC transporter permease n=1 Tax=Candidatus Avipropionibacterium avicola TaxID=2840701 RepID=A0A9D1GV35_9ACTN|nr:ABC transporter permease [Candidatus Avipropionibacterium avicola]